MSEFNFTPQGWECPKCKRVYSPTTIMCIACPQHTKTITTTDLPVGTLVGEGGFGLTNGTSTASTMMMHNFQEGDGTSKTKCKICGREKFEHGHISHT
jgi:uncharacterized OB-fold protein